MMLAIGCESEGDPGQGTGQGNAVLTAKIASNNELTWLTGHSIFTNVSLDSYVYKGAEPANTARFEGGGFSIPATGLFSAYVGEDETSVVAGANVSMVFTAPNEWMYDSNNSPLGTMVAYSKTSELDFYQIDGFLRFNILGNSELEGPQPSVSFIEVTGAAGEPVSGNVTVRFANDGTVKSLSYNATDDTSVTMNMEENPLQLSPDTPIEVIVPIAARTYEKGVYFIIYTDDGNYMKRTAADVTSVVRGEVTDVPQITFSADPKPIDLSANGHANCYIVTNEGPAYYCFDATVIGNGDEGLCEGAHVTSTKIKPKGAKLLWKAIVSSKLETGDTKPPLKTTSVKLQKDGTVTFNTQSNTGNALIAVYDNEKCDGEPLWTWHIWKPEGGAPALLDVKYDDTYTMMDRNLGACVTLNYPDATSGLYYQWGRKDPFFNANGIATGANFTLMENAQTGGTVEFTVKNPTTFITSTGAANFENNDWLPNAMQNSKLWGAKKTIYDPCPAGYRVADAEVFALVASATPTVMPDKIGGSASADGAGGGTNQLKYAFGDAQTQYPCSGYLLYTEAKRHDRNKSGRVWTVAGGQDNSNTSRVFSYNTTGDDVKLIDAERALAHPVRCQKIK